MEIYDINTKKVNGNSCNIKVSDYHAKILKDRLKGRLIDW